MTQRIDAGGLRVAQALYDFIEHEALPGTGIEAERFWSGLSAIIHELAPRNRALLARRDELQARIDAWHLEQRGRRFAPAAYKAFLAEIGYLLPEGEDFTAGTANVDPEISTVAGPQLVVPVTNARYALNAANARWGSLYDALYGTDALPEDGGAARGTAFNPVRARRVIAFARDFLDRVVPLARGSHHDATGYAVEDGRLAARPGSPSPTGSPAIRALPRARRWSFWSTTASTSRSGSIARIRSAGPTRPGSPTSCSRRRSPPSRTARTRSRRSMPRTRSGSIATG
jgi:malate synthase